MNRLCLVLSALLLAAACSRPTPVDTTVAATSSPSPSPEPSPSPTMPVALEGSVNDRGAEDLTSSGANVSLDMTVAELGFDPTFVKVSPASNVTVKLTGEQDVEHTFTIDSLSVDRELSSEPSNITFQLPTEGPILFYCRFHQEQGMKGAFYFTEGQELSASPLPETDSGAGSGSSGGSSYSGGTSSRRTTSSGSGSGTSQPQQPSGGAPAVDPLDEEINRAVAGDEIDQEVAGGGEPVEEDSGEAKSEPATPSDTDAGVASVSEPGAPGSPGGEG